MSAERGQFDRRLLPSPDEYFRREGVNLRGGGLWRSALCPFHEDRSPSFRVNMRDGGFYCHGCGAAGGDVLAFHMRKHGFRFIDAARDLGALADDAGEILAAMPKAPAGRPPKEIGSDSAPINATPPTLHGLGIDKILDETTGLAGTVGAEYLIGRGCPLPPADGDLRFHPNLRRYGFAGPCLVGRITAACDASETLGLHLTWLKRGGGLWRRSERRYAGRKAGGVVRLWPDECVSQGLGIAEGIETALATARVFQPVWATLDAGNLAAFPVLPGEVALSIFADRDKSGTGQKAALACAERWLAAGREVRVLAALRTGADMADLATEVA